MITQAWIGWMSACCCHGAQGCHRDLCGRHRAKGLRDRSDEGELEPRSCRVPFMCVCRVQGGVCADSWYPDVWRVRRTLMLKLRVTAGCTGAGAINPLEAHQPSSESNAATGRPSALTGTTRSDTETPPRVGPTARVSLTQSHCRSSVLRRFGGSIACREVWIEAACTPQLQAKCGVVARIEHEVVRSVKVYDVLCSHCCCLRGHTPK